MYTERDRDVILADMLASVREDVDKREGSVVHDMLAPPAEEHEMLGYALESILENGFMDTAQMEYVDKRANEQGIYRKQAESATGVLVFTGREGMAVELGTDVIAESGGEQIALQTVEYAVIDASGSATVSAVATIAGLSGNIDAESSLICEELPDLLVTNPSAFIGGVDVEPDDELKSRYLLKVRKPITSGNVYHYELWAREVEGISQARVQPLWDGPGTVKVLVINAEGRAPTTEKVAEVAAHIEGVRPIGASVTVVPITEIPVNISATLTLEGELLAADVLEAVSESIAAYLAEAQTEVRYSRIAGAIVATEGIKDYSDLLIGKGGAMSAANIAISADDVAVVGEVTLA